jgi:uncharacterized protein (TIGR02300 family)
LYQRARWRFDTPCRAKYQPRFPENLMRQSVARPELGTKRVDPVTGRKFYDLGKDPIVSPYTGQSYPRSFFEPVAKTSRPANDEEDEVETPVKAGAPEFVPLAEAEPGEAGKDLPVDDIEIEDDGGETDDTFLEEEEEDEGDVADLIDGELEEDEEH